MSLQHQLFEYDSEVLNHYFLCHYRPRIVGSDDLSKSILNFKQGRPLDVMAWTSCAISELQRIPIGAQCLVLRALGGTELMADPRDALPLDKIGQEIALAKDGHYVPSCLRKSRVTSSLKSLSRESREQELYNVYSFSLSASLKNPKEILIVDDILTTGSTLRAITLAIRTVLPTVRITFYTLAVADRLAMINQNIDLRSKAYEWEANEWTAVAEPFSFLVMLEELKERILGTDK